MTCMPCLTVADSTVLHGKVQLEQPTVSTTEPGLCNLSEGGPGGKLRIVHALACACPTTLSCFTDLFQLLILLLQLLIEPPAGSIASMPSYA